MWSRLLAFLLMIVVLQLATISHRGVAAARDD
jgi:hypothetical protein